METEKFFSGYCRQLDCGRMVAVVLEDGEMTETDCCYGSCVYQTNCPIAKEIEELLKDSFMRRTLGRCP